ETAVVAGALGQTGVGVSGTLAIGFTDPALAGVYAVSGQVHGPRVALVGANPTGVLLRWRGRVLADGSARGRARLRRAGKHGAGALVIAPRSPEPPPATPPASCDSPFFSAQVMGRVLQPICAGCHITGGAAQHANFRVTLGDALATEASVALQIDTAHPDDS